MIKVEMHQHV